MNPTLSFEDTPYAKKYWSKIRQKRFTSPGAYLDWAETPPVIVFWKMDSVEDALLLINHEHIHWVLMNFIEKRISYQYDKICGGVDKYHSSSRRVNE